MGRVDAPFARLPHEMTGAAYPLQALGHRFGRLQLDNQIDCANVDAQFQRGGADERRQTASLQVSF